MLLNFFTYLATQLFSNYKNAQKIIENERY